MFDTVKHTVVLERWITDRPFHSARHPASSDLDVACGENAQQILEEHWATWITEQDWAWISQQGINTVRIPVSDVEETAP
jgi:glucan 1,3-beta-glucosidase